MNPVFAARRRADEFNSTVEGTTTDEGLDARYADLLELVTALRAEPAPEARPEFVADLRTQLMAAAEAALAPDPAARAVERRVPVVRRSPRERRLAVAVGGFAIISASASMAVAAQSALPGDTLYPLKRAIENVQTGVQRDADDKGTSMLDNAAGRLAEVDELSRSGDQDADVISQTLRDFSDQATEASDLLLDDFAETGRKASIQDLRTFTSDSMAALENLQGLVPADARAALIEAGRVLGQIDRQAVKACPVCGDLRAAVSLGDASGLAAPFEELLDQAPSAAPDADPGGKPDRPDQTPPATGTEQPPPPDGSNDTPARTSAA